MPDDARQALNSLPPLLLPKGQEGVWGVLRATEKRGAEDRSKLLEIWKTSLIDDARSASWTSIRERKDKLDQMKTSMYEITVSNMYSERERDRERETERGRTYFARSWLNPREHVKHIQLLKAISQC